MEEESKLVDWLENKLINGQNWNPLLNQRSPVDINTFHVKKEKFKKFPRFPFLTSSEKNLEQNNSRQRMRKGKNEWEEMRNWIRIEARWKINLSVGKTEIHSRS